MRFSIKLLPLAAAALVIAVANWWLSGTTWTATAGQEHSALRDGVDPPVPVLAATAPRWTFAVLCLGGYNHDNLLLMALTLAACLVVDDTIVMANPQQRAAAVILQGPDVVMVGSAIGGIANSGINTGRLFISLKPSNEHVATDG